MAEILYDLTVVADEEITLKSEDAIKGEKGDVFVPTVNRDETSEDFGLLTWELQLSTLIPDEITPVNILGPDGKVYVPSVDNDGNISWVLDASPEDPPTTNIRGPRGFTFTPSVDGETGILTWTNDGGLDNPDAVDLTGPRGFTFTPAIDSDGNISWSNDGELENPATQNIRGPQGFIYTPTVSADGILTWSNNGGLDNPDAVDLTGPQGIQGVQGIQGEKGDPFAVAKIYSSVAEMEAGYETDGVAEGCFVVIDTGNVEDEENARLYVKGTTGYAYITDLSGAQGMQGPQGVEGPRGQTGKQGIQGIQGEKGDPFTYDDFTSEQLEALRGPRGLKGDTGAGLEIKGSYDTEDALRAEHTTGTAGEAYLVNGYLYVWDEINSDWLNTGNIQGPQGYTFIPAVSSDGVLSWTNNGGLDNPAEVDLTGPQGATFIPTVDADGNLSWANDDGLDNPETVNIKGPQGEAFTYEDLTEEQIAELSAELLAAADLNYATKDYVEQNGGKIDAISVNGVEQEIVDKKVDIQTTSVQIIRWEESD